MRGYKGYGLALLVDIFAGVLSGAATGPSVGRTGENKPADVGHYFAAVRIDAFREVEEFKTHMDQMLQDLKDAPKAMGQERIYIHGEKEFELAEKYARDGVPLMAEVVEALTASGKAVGVPFDLEPVGRLD
jgi:LDH2 family malate/lactate/ureidoglycolate dehydrogenase